MFLEAPVRGLSSEIEKQQTLPRPDAKLGAHSIALAACDDPPGAPLSHGCYHSPDERKHVLPAILRVLAERPGWRRG